MYYETIDTPGTEPALRCVRRVGRASPGSIRHRVAEVRTQVLGSLQEGLEGITADRSPDDPVSLEYPVSLKLLSLHVEARSGTIRQEAPAVAPRFMPSTLPTVGHGFPFE